MPTCSECPSFLGRQDVSNQENVYGKSLGVPACPRRGMLLGTSAMTQMEESSYQEEVAEKCSDFGKPIKGAKTLIALSIGIGVPKEAPLNAAPVSSCRSCFFYVTSGVMSAEIGVKLGLCSKFAKLIPEAKAASIAQQCQSAARVEYEEGMTPAQHHEELLAGLTLNPVLRKYVSLGEVLDRTHDTDTSVTEVKKSIEPREYETDAEVTGHHRANGIRAWRELRKNNRKVLLPIFDSEFFDANERSKIPQTGDDSHPELYVDHMDLAFTVAVLWRELDETPALHGIAGTGKTEFFSYMSWLMQLPFERLSITRSTELDDLAGKMHFESRVVREATETESAVIQGETIFKPGRVPLAWAKPCVIVFDEPNVGSPDVWQFIRPLTDNSKQLVLDQNEGQVIKRHDHAYLGMAMNPAWDMRNIGAEVISDADGSRLMHISVELPSAKVERRVITDRCKADNYDIENDLLDRIMRIAGELRVLSDEQTLPVTWGLRPQLKVARASKWFDLRDCYRLAVADYQEPTVREMILDVVKNHA